ncbi:MFS transporter [Chloroflexota bacterium]
MTAQTGAISEVSPKEYNRRIWAWTMYDWANSAFATTILAAVLPIYFSQVAGATLPSATVATAYWSTGLSISLIIIAVLAPILGTISDVMRGKKRFLAIFVGIGIISTALLVFVQTGDWVLAAIFGILGRIGFSGANVFYDALLPHVAREQDRDWVSTRGYAMGYLGGGLLLALNVVMIQFLPGTWGPRLSFLSVAIWWAVFSIPIFMRVPEPPAATVKLKRGENVISVSFQRLWDTLLDISRFRELFKFLVAFLIYNDGIGTIIGLAAIYGTELGFGMVELILALLLVQFVGIPFSLIFGRLPGGTDKRRPIYLAFVIYNLIALPLAGIISARVFPADEIGAQPEPYLSTEVAVGEGLYTVDSDAFQYSGTWHKITVPDAETGAKTDITLRSAAEPGEGYDFLFNGQRVEVVYTMGPDHGIWEVFLDGNPLLDPADGMAQTIDAYNPTVRYDVTQTFVSEEPGEHIISLINTSSHNPDSRGNVITLVGIKVLPAQRQSDLVKIIGLILIVEAIGLVLAFLFGRLLFSGLAGSLNTKRSILLALTFYAVIAVWAFFLNSVIEFWFLAWMVAVVQGGSQALSRSLFAAMSPASQSGEFFGLYGIMEKFSAVIGPLIFASVGILFGSSRPAVLSLIVIFVLGGYLLSRVNVDEGQRIAQLEDKAVFQGEIQA